MSLKIAVRGHAVRVYPADVANVSLTIDAQGADRDEVLASATAAHVHVSERLAALQGAGAVVHWSADSVRVVAERPWNPEGKQSELVQHARMAVRAEFQDVVELSVFIAEVSANELVEVGSVVWDVTSENRRLFTADVRAEAVADAVAKAQAYADAIGAGPVEATHLADPGMLADNSPSPRVMMAMASAASDAPGMTFVPDDITIRCEVDARFKA